MISTYLNWLEERGQIFTSYSDQPTENFMYKGSDMPEVVFFLHSSQNQTLFTNEEERLLFIKIVAALKRPWKKIGVYGVYDLNVLSDLLNQTKHLNQVLLMPVDSHPKETGSAVWIPDLSAMLFDPDAKKQAWYALRSKFLEVTN